jgi:hypothetical protein
VWHWQKGWWWHAEWGWFCSLDVANLHSKEVSLEKERVEEENQHLTQELGLFTREFDEISRENKALKEELHGKENTIAELGDNLEGSRLRIEELEGEKQSLCDAATDRIQELDEQLQLQQRRPVITIDGEDLFRRERALKESLWNQQEEEHLKYIRQQRQSHQDQIHEIRAAHAVTMEELVAREKLLWAHDAGLQQKLSELAKSLKTQQEIGHQQQLAQTEHVKQLAERLQTQEIEHLQQVAFRDRVLVKLDAEYIEELASRDQALKKKEVEHLQTLAEHDHQFLRLTTVLRDLQMSQQQQDEAVWTAQEQSVNVPEIEQVSKDQPSSDTSQFQPPPPPLPPIRCSLDELFPPQAVCNPLPRQITGSRLKSMSMSIGESRNSVCDM